MDPTLATVYVASSPSSTKGTLVRGCMFAGSIVHIPVHIRHDVRWQAWDHWEVYLEIGWKLIHLSWCFCTLYKLLSLPLLLMTLEAKVPKHLTLEALDVAQVLPSLVTRTWLLFLPFLTLLSSSFLVALLRLTNGENILLLLVEVIP